MNETPDLPPAVPDSDMPQVVRDSALPLMLVAVSDRCILEVSGPLTELFRGSRAQLLGHDVSELINGLAGAGVSLDRVASGAIDVYRTFRRSFTRLDGRSLDTDIWLSAYTEPPRDAAIAVVLPVDRRLLPRLPASSVPVEDPLLAIGTVDDEWRINRISADIEPMLGYPAGSLVGSPALAGVHPADIPALLTAVAHPDRFEAVSTRLRVRRSDGTWLACRIIVSTNASSETSGLGFALVPMPGIKEQPGGEFEDRLHHCVREFSAAGFAVAASELATGHELPALSQLTSREMEIVSRLSAGDRVPLIARSLFLGESTVRNHLSSVFRKFGVSTQQELLTALRAGGTAPGPGGGQSDQSEKR